MKVRILILLTFSWIKVNGQEILEFDRFISLVKANNPIAKQAQNNVGISEMQIREARGSFDPGLVSKNNAKEFEGKNYYALSKSGLEIPTWFGAKVKAGYELNDGVFLNPENYVTSEGVTYLGVELPLLQGLLIDERRSTLRQSQLMNEIAQQQRFLVLNDLILKATEDYYLWSYYYQQYRMYETAALRAKERFEAVKIGFAVGNRPAIDTLESLIQYQNRQLSLNDARTGFAVQSLMLSNYLWDENGSPLQIADSTRPEELTFDKQLNLSLADSLAQASDTMLKSHPKLRSLEFKLNQLDIERRWKSQKLWPKLDAQYNLLRRDFGFSGFVFDNNFKWGLTFKFPIFLRQARGALAQTKFKIENVQLETNLKRLELRNKINTYLTEYRNAIVQAELSESNANNYNGLFNAERIKFGIGESSLLKLNLREIKLLEAQTKKFKSQMKAFTYYYKVMWAQGNLGRQ